MKSIFPEDLVNHKHQEIALSNTVCPVTGWAADKLPLLLCVNSVAPQVGFRLLILYVFITCCSRVYMKLSACSHITSSLRDAHMIIEGQGLKVRKGQ